MKEVGHYSQSSRKTLDLLYIKIQLLVSVSADGHVIGSLESHTWAFLMTTITHGPTDLTQLSRAHVSTGRDSGKTQICRRNVGDKRDTLVRSRCDPRLWRGRFSSPTVASALNDLFADKVSRALFFRDNDFSFSSSNDVVFRRNYSTSRTIHLQVCAEQ